MIRKIKMITAVVLLLYGIVFAVNRLANATITPTPDTATIEKAKTDFLNNICSGHGGVNCSILNSDTSIVCNDGAIDTSFPTVYGIPQCQEIIREIANKQSDFMAESGCYPPSEMGCFSETSYRNLLKRLGASGLATSELGKGELFQCREDIKRYNIANTNYKKCLTNNGDPDFVPYTDKLVAPLLRPLFCSIFYGTNSYFDTPSDMCTCDAGFFMFNEQCVQADQICQIKYGLKASAKNGNCSVASTTSTFIKSIIAPKTAQPKITPAPLRTPLETPIQNASYLPQISTTVEPIPQQGTVETLDNPSKEARPSFIQNIISSLVSGFKNMLKLF